MPLNCTIEENTRLRFTHVKLPHAFTILYHIARVITKCSSCYDDSVRDLCHFCSFRLSLVTICLLLASLLPVIMSKYFKFNLRKLKAIFI